MISGNIFRFVAVFAVCMTMTARALAEDDTTSLEGKPAPDVSLKTLDGKDFKLSSLKGDVVMMDYWATWCPPCRASLPHVNDLANDASLKAKGLHVLAIDSKEQTPTVQKFVDDNKFTFMVPLDPEGAFGKNYLVHGIPTTVIVGRNGTIKKVFIGFGPGRETEIKAAVEAALNEPKPQG